MIEILEIVKSIMDVRQMREAKIPPNPNEAVGNSWVAQGGVMRGWSAWKAGSEAFSIARRLSTQYISMNENALHGITNESQVEMKTTMFCST